MWERKPGWKFFYLCGQTHLFISIHFEWFFLLLSLQVKSNHHPDSWIQYRSRLPFQKQIAGKKRKRSRPVTSPERIKISVFVTRHESMLSRSGKGQLTYFRRACNNFTLEVGYKFCAVAHSFYSFFRDSECCIQLCLLTYARDFFHFCNILCWFLSIFLCIKFYNISSKCVSSSEKYKNTHKLSHF